MNMFLFVSVNFYMQEGHFKVWSPFFLSVVRNSATVFRREKRRSRIIVLRRGSWPLQKSWKSREGKGGMGEACDRFARVDTT